jgi:hypothetical protein
MVSIVGLDLPMHSSGANASSNCRTTDVRSRQPYWRHGSLLPAPKLLGSGLSGTLFHLVEIKKNIYSTHRVSYKLDHPVFSSSKPISTMASPSLLTKLRAVSQISCDTLDVQGSHRLQSPYTQMTDLYSCERLGPVPGCHFQPSKSSPSKRRASGLTIPGNCTR